MANPLDINENKSVLLDVKIHELKKKEITRITGSSWKTKDITHLCVNFSENMESLIQNNLIRVVQKVETDLRKWSNFNFTVWYNSSYKNENTAPIPVVAGGRGLLLFLWPSHCASKLNL